MQSAVVLPLTGHGLSIRSRELHHEAALDTPIGYRLIKDSVRNVRPSPAIPTATR